MFCGDKCYYYCRLSCHEIFDHLMYMTKLLDGNILVMLNVLKRVIDTLRYNNFGPFSWVEKSTSNVTVIVVEKYHLRFVNIPGPCERYTFESIDIYHFVCSTARLIYDMKLLQIDPSV